MDRPKILLFECRHPHLAVAAKLPSDITTPMTRPLERMTKVSGVVLICIAINHVMPCLSLMNGVGILSSVIALGILVVTTFVNVMIQINTGIISDPDAGFGFLRDVGSFFPLFSVVMLSKFVIFVSYSLTITATKKVLKHEYYVRHQNIAQEMIPNNKFDDFSLPKMEVMLKKYWLMALTSSPDFTVLRSGLCLVSGMMDYIAIVIPIYFCGAAALDRTQFEAFTSAYTWSPPLILLIQAIAISVGIVGSLLRVTKSQPTKDFSDWMALLTFDGHWSFLLHEWREAPVTFCGSRVGRRMRMVFFRAKSRVVNVLIKLQTGVLLLSKFFHIFMRCLWWVTLGWAWALLKMILTPLNCTTPDEVEEDLRGLVEYVLPLEEEDKNNLNYAMPVVKQWHNYPVRWIKSGRTEQPNELLLLLRNNCRLSTEFEELGRQYDKLLVQPTVGSSERRPPSRCWSLPLTTLAALVQTLAAPGQNNAVINLMDSIGQGLKYVRFVEKNLGTSETRKKQEAADVVWEGIELHCRWLGMDLSQMVVRDWSDAVTKLDNIAKDQLRQSQSGKKLKWPSRVQIATCMRDIAGIMHSNINIIQLEGGSQGSLGKLQRIVAYILGGCLVNLPLAIFAQCSSGNFGEREEAVKDAAIMLGETEEILNWLSENENLRNFYTAHREAMRLPSITDDYVSSEYGV